MKMTKRNIVDTLEEIQRGISKLTNGATSFRNNSKETLEHVRNWANSEDGKILFEFIKNMRNDKEYRDEWENYVESVDEGEQE